MSLDDVSGSRGLVQAGDHDADAIGRGADAAALVATDLARSTDCRAARHAHLIGRFTEDFDATAAERRADTAALVATILFHSAETWTARLACGLLRWAVLVSAYLTESHALTAALIAAILARTAHQLIARLAHAEVFGTRHVVGNADAAALWATGRTFDAENCRAGVVVDWEANSGAIRAAGGGIAAVARIIDALESFRAREPPDPAAHTARSRNLR